MLQFHYDSNVCAQVLLLSPDIVRTLLQVLFTIVPGMDEHEYAESYLCTVYVLTPVSSGNLAVAVTLAAIELGIRKPDAIMAAYAPFLVELALSPSRLLSVFDPLLPQGVLLACLDAYAGNSRYGVQRSCFFSRV